jgi:hypothetical protein
MDANQRSEVNNQTNNVANEKWTPGSKGKTADDGPLDHTYPNGLGAQQQGRQGVDTMGTQPPQMSGGSGTVQGITDSHQRVMDEQKSGAYGMLEQPIGHRAKDSGVDLAEGHDMQRDVVRAQMGAQDPRQPDLQGGSMQSGQQGGTSGGGMRGPQSPPTSMNAGSASGNRQQGSSLYVSDNSTRSGGGMRGPLSGAQGQSGQEAQQGNMQRGVHESNDVAGGLPRSPGNTGAQNASVSTDRSGSQTGTGAADSGPPAHQSNDAAGGYPRSPGYANRLNGDENMDDDTGFKRKP